MALEPSRKGPRGVRQGVGNKAGRGEQACPAFGECREASVVGEWDGACSLLGRGRAGLARPVEAGPRGACVVFQKPC